MERETGVEPATSSLGIFVSIENKEQWRSQRCIQVQGNQQLQSQPPSIGGFWEGKQRALRGIEGEQKKVQIRQVHRLDRW